MPTFGLTNVKDVKKLLEERQNVQDQKDKALQDKVDTQKQDAAENLKRQNKTLTKEFETKLEFNKVITNKELKAAQAELAKLDATNEENADKMLSLTRQIVEQEQQLEKDQLIRQIEIQKADAKREKVKYELEMAIEDRPTEDVVNKWIEDNAEQTQARVDSEMIKVRSEVKEEFTEANRGIFAVQEQVQMQNEKLDKFWEQKERETTTLSNAISENAKHVMKIMDQQQRNTEENQKMFLSIMGKQQEDTKATDEKFNKTNEAMLNLMKMVVETKNPTTTKASDNPTTTKASDEADIDALLLTAVEESNIAAVSRLVKRVDELDPDMLKIAYDVAQEKGNTIIIKVIGNTWKKIEQKKDFTGNSYQQPGQPPRGVLLEPGMYYAAQANVGYPDNLHGAKSLQIDYKSHAMQTSNNWMADNKGLSASPVQASSARQLQPSELKDMGNSMLNEGKVEEAIQFYSQAINLEPNNHTLYGNRSAAYVKVGKCSEALADSEKAISIKQNWPKGYFRKGTALAHLSQWTDAMAMYEIGLQLEPGNEQMKESWQACKDKKCFKCGFSPNMAVASTKMTPCNHSFCPKCNVKYGKIYCPVCQMKF